MEKRLRSLWSSAIGVFAVCALITGSLLNPLSAQNAAANEGDAAWGLTLTRISASPVPSGSVTQFRAQLACSGVAAPHCTDGEIIVPLSEWFQTSGVTVANHPSIASWRVLNSNLIITLIDEVASGIATSFDFSLTSSNYTTPNGTLAEITATIDGTNAEAVSASADVELTASGAMSITKFNPGRAADGVALPTGLPLRYTISLCAAGAPELGRLALTDATLVDTLPEGAEFVAVSAGGEFTPPNTVTWDLGDFQAPSSCSSAPYWVEVSYPDDRFGPADVVENTATVNGTYVGETDQFSATSSVNHTFGAIKTGATLCKAQWNNSLGSPSVGCNSDTPVEVAIGTTGNGSRTFTWELTAHNNSSIGAMVSMREPLPCATVTQPNEFGKIDFGSSDTEAVCEQPVVRVHAFSQSGTNTTQQYFADGSIGYITPAGERKKFVGSSPAQGDVISEIYVDEVPLAAASTLRFLLQVSLNTTVMPEDTATNRASFDVRFVDGSTLAGSQQARVKAVSGVTAFSYKSATETRITLAAGAIVAEDYAAAWTGGLVIADLLPAGLSASQLAPVVVQAGSGNKLPAAAYQTEVIDNYAESGRTLVRVTVAEGFPLYMPIGGWLLPSSYQVTVTLAMRDGGSFPNLGAPTNVMKVWTNNDSVIERCVQYANVVQPQLDDPLDWNGNGIVDNDPNCRDSATMRSGLPAAPLVEAFKEVKGNQDTDYVGFPNVARADPSQPGTIDYRMRIANYSTLPATDVVIYDVFPAPGDTGVSAAQALVSRGSQWRPLLAGAVAVPDGWAVHYSTAENPCRPEVGDGSDTWPAGCTDDWSEALPSDPAEVTAIRLSHPGDLVQGVQGNVTWSMSFPAQVPVQGEVAWNSLAFSAIRADDEVRMLTSEPPKVGVAVGETNLSVEKSADRTTAGLGEIVTYTVRVFHDTVVVFDPVTGAVRYVDRLTGEPTTAVSGGVGVVVTDQLPPQLELVPNSVTTTSGSYDPDTGEWSIGTVEVGSVHSLTMQAKVIDSGTIVNVAEITANEVPDQDAPEGACDPAVNDTCAQVAVEAGPAAVSLQKQVYDPLTRVWMDAQANPDGSYNPDGEHATVASGTPVQYRFIVQNTGKSVLSGVTVTDPLFTDFCSALTVFNLQPGQSRTMACTLQTGWGVGGHVNIATVTAVSGAGDTLTQTDTAQVLVPTPSLTVVKRTNGADANTPDAADVPNLRPYENVTWTYTITNTGEEPLRNLTLTDNVERDAEFTCVFDATGLTFTLGAAGSTLPVAASATCSVTGQVQQTEATQAFPDGVYANTARVTAQGVTSAAGTNSSDSSHYRASALEPGISILKLTNGTHVATATDAPFIRVGGSVNWSYEVTNTGNTPLNDVTVTDDREGSVECPATQLAPEESMTCTATAAGGAQLGAYSNLATVSGQPADSEGEAIDELSPVIAQDDSFYFGAESSISLTKFTQEIEASAESGGPLVADQTAVKWTYVVHNDGNTPLTGVVVSDDMEGDIECPDTSLAPGQLMTCELSGIAQPGQYRNTGSVTAEGPEATVTDSHPSFYFGVQPLIEMRKSVNQNTESTADRPERVYEGDPVEFAYEVSNAGNVALTEVSLVDDPEGVILCPAEVLDVGESMTCTLTVEANEGSYRNIATVSGTGPDTVGTTGQNVSGVTATSTDEAHYEGVRQPQIELEKRTQGHSATDPNDPDVPHIALGEDVNWTYEVTNSGGVRLVNIAVVDSIEGYAACPAETLDPGASMTCEITGTADTIGLYTNSAQVTGSVAPLDGNLSLALPQVSDDDESNYIGVHVALDLEKWVEPAKRVVAGDTVNYGFLVTNSSTVQVDKVTLDDPLLGLGEITCTVLPLDGSDPTAAEHSKLGLAPGQSAECHAPYTVTADDATAGQIINAATATGETVVGSLVSRTAEVIIDVDRAELVLEKRTNGKIVAGAIDPSIPAVTVGNDVVWSYTLYNTGTIAVTDIALTDDREGAIKCPSTVLQPGEEMSCTLSGVATVGVYTNVATATGNTLTGGHVPPATAESRYLGTLIPLPLPVTGGQAVLVILFAVGLMGSGAALLLRRERKRRMFR